MNEDPATRRFLDLQDCLLVGGVGFLEASALVIWWPSALILAGVFCFSFVLLIERERTTNSSTKGKKEK